MESCVGSFIRPPHRILPPDVAPVATKCALGFIQRAAHSTDRIKIHE